MKKALVYVQSAMITFALLISMRLLGQNTSPYWSLVGNTNATTSSKLGNTNSIPLRLMTNNSTRIYISPSAGYVGIGTSSPSARLHVNAASGTSPLRVQINGSTKLYMSSAGGLSVGSSTAAPSNGLYVAGKIGIGTNAPTNKLHVVGSSRFDSSVSIYNGGLSATTTNIAAVSGRSDVGNGLYGSSRYAAGVFGISEDKGVSGSGKYGVYGTTSYQYGYGVYGASNSSDGYAVFGTGITYGIGVAGSSTYNKGVVGSSTNSYGGYFESFSAVGLRATSISGDYAAVFDGPVYSTVGYQTSDRNLKQNIEPFDDALNLIDKLKPRYYEFKTDEQYHFLHLPEGKHYGLIAQDVEALLPNLVSTADHEVLHPMSIQKDQTSVIAPPDPSPTKESITIKALNYIELVPIMIRGMQELSEKNKEIDALKLRIDRLEELVSRITNAQGGGALTNMSSLEQNTPNPVNGITTIRYHIPETTKAAMLILSNAKGQLVKTMAISKNGMGQLSLNTATLASGTYSYTLYVDEKAVDTKRLIISR